MRLQKPLVTVSLLEPSQMRRKVADLIRAHLAKKKTQKCIRKPILVCTRKATTAAELTEYLKRELRDSDVRKIVCLGTQRDLDD